MVKGPFKEWDTVDTFCTLLVDQEVDITNRLQGRALGNRKRGSNSGFECTTRLVPCSPNLDLADYHRLLRNLAKISRK